MDSECPDETSEPPVANHESDLCSEIEQLRKELQEEREQRNALEKELAEERERRMRLEDELRAKSENA